MAIASMMCGIIGLLGSIVCGINISNSRRMLEQLGNDTISILVKTKIENDLSIFYFFLTISIILVILAFIFGKITRKKGKDTKYYGMANAGFIMGLIGVLFITITLLAVFIFIILLSIYTKAVLPLLKENVQAWSFPLIFILSVTFSIVLNIFTVKKVLK
jgi:hypothetical protein